MNDTPEQEHWSSRHAKPVIFLILTFVAIGIYLAFAIPIAVFPETNFPRIIVGLDNGVAPINQMQTMVTRPVEEALNSVPGLELVRSLTSRGTAEIDLFFDWSVDILQTLNLVNAALAQVRPELPSSTNIVANRLTFAAFPIIGYSLTLEHIPQTRLWELGPTRSNLGSTAFPAYPRSWCRADRCRNFTSSPIHRKCCRPR